MKKKYRRDIMDRQLINSLKLTFDDIAHETDVY